MLVVSLLPEQGGSQERIPLRHQRHPLWFPLWSLWYSRRMTPSIANNANILIFDSGIGGLSVAAEITKALPQHPIVYVADNRLYPYGIQSDDSLLNRAKDLFPTLEAQYNPSIIVIACNSASTLILEEVRAITHAPIIGVVPAIKPAAATTLSGQIGLLATKGTIGRTYTQDLIDQFASQHTITKVGSDILVSQAERKIHGYPVEHSLIRQELTPIIQQPHVDTVILGCTHFPLIKNEIKRVLGSTVQLIDNGEAIANRTTHLLSEAKQLLPLTSPPPVHSFIFTAENKHVAKISPALRARGFSDIQIGNH